MSATSEFDVQNLENLALPFDTTTKELAATPRYVAGQNMYVTLGGKLALAPGINDTGLTSFTLTKRPDRLTIYETLENPPKVYVVASIFNSVTGWWEAWWLRVSAGVPAWTSVGTLRDVDKSTRPHEFLCARGLCFIKGFPDSSHDKYGTVIFDGSSSGPRTVLWGLPSPTTAARCSASSGWAASTNAVTVLWGWQYVYAWKDLLGNYSTRSPLETDPSQNQSTTGAFTNKKPQVVVQGNADTTNIPQIGIFRTTDGGGTFCFVEDITNTGAGAITYTDQHRVPSTTNDPTADSQLNTQNIAPSSLSNIPPPPVSPGKVIGTDTVEAATNLAYYQGRVWYAISRIYFSGREEIINGVPEECFPNPNGVSGNYYVIEGQPRLMAAGKNALYIITSNEQLFVTGQDRSNFLLNSQTKDIGAAYGHNRAICAYRDGVFFLTQDLQIAAMVAGSDPSIISGAIGTTLRAAITANTNVTVDLNVWIRDGNSWLIVNVIDKATPANTQQFVYDLNRQFWFIPWKKKISAMAFGRVSESDSNKHLVVLTWDGSTAKLGVLDPAFFQDTTGTNQLAPSATTNLFNVPNGNHVNPVNNPVRTPIIAYLLTERTKFTSDTDPTVNMRLDEFSGAFTALTAFAPTYRAQHTSFNTKWWPIEQAAQRVQLQVSKVAANEAFELQTLGFVFKPDAGT
jgi:hypothetical protein